MVLGRCSVERRMRATHEAMTRDMDITHAVSGIVGMPQGRKLGPRLERLAGADGSVQ